MGCCPSKHKHQKHGDLVAYDEYPPTERAEDDYYRTVRPTSITPDARDHQVYVSPPPVPQVVVMDRGVPPTNEHKPSIDRIIGSAADSNQVDLSIDIQPEGDTEPSEIGRVSLKSTATSEAATPSRPVRQMVMPSPSRPPVVASPSKPPVNFDEMPINSMYHRIHLVEVEEMEDRRRQELQREAERREREVEEYRAAMLASTGS